MTEKKMTSLVERTQEQDEFEAMFQGANATKFDGGIVKSDDGLFEWERCMAEYVSISCSKTGLSDNTHGQVGNHVVHLQYAEESAQELMDHPDGRKLIADARDFRAVARTL